VDMCSHQQSASVFIFILSKILASCKFIKIKDPSKKQEEPVVLFKYKNRIAVL
jgi:hypothetical protein